MEEVGSAVSIVYLLSLASFFLREVALYFRGLATAETWREWEESGFETCPSIPPLTPFLRVERFLYRSGENRRERVTKN